MYKRIAVLTLAALLLANLGCSGASQENNEENNASTNNTTPTGNNNTAVNNQSANNQTSGNNATTTNNQTSPVAGYEGLVINEVVAAGSPDWVEFKNTSSAAIDLTGCTISDDLMDAAKGSIPDGTMIAAGGYLVIDIADETVGFKIGGDEAFGIFAPDGTVIDSVDWDEGASPEGGAFARLPDGTGDFTTTNTPTREAANTIVDNNQTTNNQASVGCGNGIKDGDDSCDGDDLGDATCEMLGFDGGMLSCDAGCALVTDACEMMPGTDVVINEVTSSGDDQIELHNLSAVEVDLSGWIVADDKYPEDNADIYIFASGSKIEAGGYLVLVKGTDHTFGIGGSDTITVYNAGGDIVDQAAIDPDGAADTSFCRLPDATGDFQSCDVATFGASNE